MNTSDSELLQRFVANHSESAFRDLVHRYVGLVYSVALRQGAMEPADAEEVSQRVFVLLAEKASSLTDHPSITAWLFTTTRHVASRHLRTETRRRIREQKAHEMSQTLASDGPIPEWTALRPVMDEAIAELEESDRKAVLWRYFEKQGFACIGSRLGLSEDAARKRVARALEGLRDAFSRRGISSTGAAIGLALEAHAAVEAPAGVASRICVNLTASGLLATSATARWAWAPRVGGMLSGSKLALVILGLGLAGAGWVTYRTMTSGASVPNDPATAAAIPVTGAETANGTGNAIERIRSIAQARSQKSAADLDEARRRLREVLTSPPHTSEYPPKSLLAALVLFDGQYQEAVPILMQAVRVDDSETRLWAVLGLERVVSRWAGPDPDGTRSNAMSEIRAVAGGFLSDPMGSDMIRMSAFRILCPPKGQLAGQPDRLVRYDAESLQWVEKTLHATSKQGDSFRFTVVDFLAGLGGLDPDTEQLFRGMGKLLTSASEEDRVLAAYAMARLPGEPVTGVKEQLTRTIRDRSSYYRYRAANAFGAMGTNAVEAVPLLLEYATKDAVAENGERKVVLTAACRIQPGLRASYPEIDQQLRREEQAVESMNGKPKAVSMRDGILGMALEGDESIRRSLSRLMDGGGNAEEGQKRREQFLSILEREMQSGTDQEKAVFRHVAELIREAPVASEEKVETPKPLDLRNLTLAARVLLVDVPIANSNALERALEQFETEKIRSGVFPTANREGVEALSKVLESVDPEFRKQWCRQVLKDYAWLDRVMPK